jgi:2-polyprenyl-3-methyl-5-hydroxy-6-metoxy-1,4-benzoquinol methylase
MELWMLALVGEQNQAMDGSLGHVCPNHITEEATAMKRLARSRAEHEITHGKKLAQGDTESFWGWGTPAGQLRAKRRAELIVRGARLQPGMCVLELGCGTGLFTEMFAQPEVELVAVDISPDLIDRARARGLPTDQVQFILSRFEDCNLVGPFDAVVGSSALHHLEVGRAVTKVHALLKQGGIMCFAEPNFLNPAVFLERKLRFLPWFSYVSPDETAFLRWQLCRLLLRAGFQDIKIQPFDWLHPATPLGLIPTVQHIGAQLEKIPILRELAGSLLIQARKSIQDTCVD